jgi:hypothetical protein
MPHKEITPDMFKDLTFVKREIPRLLVNKYRVYTSHDEFTMVEAENAKAALDACGLTNVIRVLHDNMYLDNVIRPGIIAMDAKGEPEHSTHLAPLSETMDDESGAIAVVEPTEALAPDAGLSSEDVAKLLHP